MLKAYDQQFTSTTKKSLHIIFNTLNTLLYYLVKTSNSQKQVLVINDQSHRGKGSVVKRFTCGSIFNCYFITNLLLNLW